MSQELFSIDQVAERLTLHVKTVRNYVRDGRLKATRIGKQYRIARSDLEVFTGHSMLPSERDFLQERRHLEASSIVQIDAIGPDSANQLIGSLAAFAQGRPKSEEPLRIETLYDQQLQRLKVILLGGVHSNSATLKLIAALLEH